MSAFLEACRNQRPDHTPVWFMRQAGRSLPEYSGVRGTGSILQAITEPEIVTEITLQPLRRYDVDAAILYSDIMVPIASTGFGVDIVPGIGPVVEQPFETEADLARLVQYSPEEHTPYVIESVKMLVKELEVPLIGFAGAPFTLASYLIEGRPTRDFAKTKVMMHNQPELFSKLLAALAEMSLASLRSQIEAGCQAVQMFDSWVGALSPSTYEQMILPHASHVLKGVADLGVPVIHFGTNTGELLGAMKSAGADVVGVDWRVELADARRRTDGSALQGNLDPTICLADWEVVQANAERVLRSAGPTGHIFNLGHGVLPSTDPDTLARLTDFVHAFEHES